MYKILVDKEEVVCEPNFEIKEEFMNPSSIILDKVYPKSWKGTNRVLSDYYFPKDYSKCLIYDSDENLYPYTVYGKTTQETIEGEEGTTVEGQEISITDYDSSKEHDVLVEGESNQKTTPTPENPQEIQNVTGLQNVVVCGKNLFNKATITENQRLDPNGGKNYDENCDLSDYIKIQPNTIYTRNITASVYECICFYTIDKTFISRDTTHATTTSPNNAYYVRISCYKTNLDKLQLEKNSSATTYEPYQGQSYPINLGDIELCKIGSYQDSIYKGKGYNLFDVSTIITGKVLTNDGALNDASAYCVGDYIKVEPNTTYTISYGGDTTGEVMRVGYYDESKTFLSRPTSSNNLYIITTPNNCYYIRLSYRTTTYSNVQVIEGTSSSPYEPYNAKDKWLLHKEIGKVVLDGSENLVQSGATTSSILVGAYVLTDRGIDGQVISNRFIQGNTITIGNCNVYNNGGTLYMLVDKTQISDIATLKTWLSSNNAIFYYPLATPTYTKITNEELIEQLEELYNDEFFDGVNNISTSGIYLNLHYNYVTPMPSTERPSQMINLTGNVELEIEGNTYRLPLGEKELCSNKDETIRDFIQKDEDDKWYINKRIGIIEEYNGEEITTEYMSVTGELTIGTKVQYVLENIEKEEITDETLIRQLESIGNLLIFSGIVKNSANMVLNPFKPHYCSLQVLDPSTLLSEGKTLDFVISNKTITEAINQVVSTVADYGFVVGTVLIKDDSIIGAYSTIDKTPYDVLSYLSQISGARWGTRMIDEDTTAIDFYDPELLDNLGTIECTKEYFGRNKITDLDYGYSTTDYRNKQVITSDEVFANITSSETIVANGYQTQYNTEEKIGKISSIKINGSEVTFTTNTNKELGITAEVYYNPGNQYFETDEPLSTGSVISIEYIAIVKGRQIILNSTEVNRVSDNLGRNGTISRYENRNDVTSSSELSKIAETYIKYKGVAEITLTLGSRVDFLVLGGKYNFNSPLEDLNGSYLVKSKSTKILQNDQLLIKKYTYELTNSFDTENEINYFDNQRAKANGNIGEGEYVPRNIDIENTTNIIFYDSSIEEVETTGDNILDSVLDSPFNN